MTLHFITPTFKHYALSKKLNKNIYLKMECYQPVLSFKIRGIGNLCQAAKQQGFSHIAAASAGNAGYAAAYAAKILGMQASIFVINNTPISTQDKLKQLDAKVIECGNSIDETQQAAIEFSNQNDAFFIHPFDNPLIWQGHSTIVDEIYQQTSKPDAIILSVGGGGLMSGVIQGLVKYNWQDIKLIASETIGTSSLAQSLDANQIITLPKISSAAVSLGAKKICQQAFNDAKSYNVKSVVVTDEQSLQACIDFANDNKVIVEPACGASLAVAYQNHESIKDYDNILIIVCGGINTNLIDVKLK